MLNKAFFFDRDGIVNKSVLIENKPYPPKNIDDVIINEEIKDLMCYLKGRYYVFVITNQPDFSRGKVKKKDIQLVNSYIQNRLPIDEICTCFHDNHHNCNCRKPKIGFFKYLQKKYSINMKSSFMIGDRKSDIDAGNNAGCKTIFVDFNYNETKPDNQTFTVSNLSELKILVKEIMSYD